MEITITDQICRCCMAHGELIKNIHEKFIEPDAIFDPEITYADAIYLCTNIRCDDNLPQLICSDCLDKLRVAIHFRAKCEETDVLLRKQLKPDIHLNNENIIIEENVDNTDVAIKDKLNVSSEYVISYELPSVSTGAATIVVDNQQAIVSKTSEANVTEITVIKNTKKTPAVLTKLPEVHKNWFECEQCRKGFGELFLY